MSIYTDELRALPIADKLRLVEQIWDDLGESADPIPLPDWVTREAVRRSNELRKGHVHALTHEEVWRRIEQHNG